MPSKLKHLTTSIIMTSSNGNRWPVNSPHKGQWRGALMFTLICAWTNVWTNNREAGDLWRHRAQYDVIVMSFMHATAGSTLVAKERRLYICIWLARCFKWRPFDASRPYMVLFLLTSPEFLNSTNLFSNLKYLSFIIVQNMFVIAEWNWCISFILRIF